MKLKPLYMIDGPDAAGKGTILSAVASELLARGEPHVHKHFHATPYDPQDLADDVRRAYWYAYERAHLYRRVVDFPGVHLLDRSHWTSYAVTGARWAAELARAEELTLKELGIEPVLILLTAPNDVLDARLRDRPRVTEALRALDEDPRRDAMRERYRALADTRVRSIEVSTNAPVAESVARVLTYLRRDRANLLAYLQRDRETR